MKRSTATAIAGFIAVATGTARADTVTEWNQTVIEVMKVARVAGNPWSRALAMVHVAISDAINSVQDRYTRYVATGPVAPGASAEAAATAARRILVDLFPSQKAVVEAAYTASLATIPDGPPKSQGVALGEQVAAAVQADRATDGAQAPDTYRPVTSPGVWAPTPPPLFAQYARAKPWGLASADQFRPGPPPALSSTLYARDYNETKNLGGGSRLLLFSVLDASAWAGNQTRYLFPVATLTVIVPVLVLGLGWERDGGEPRSKEREAA